MALTWSEFIARRKGFTTQYFPCEGATRTIMVCSHIWWTDQIALAILNSGYNVLLHFPLYLLYTDESAFSRFDELWNQILTTIREHKVDAILGGNSAAMLAHPKTREMLHDAAGIKLINWWWDEVRAKPPLGRAFTPEDFIQFLRNNQTLNAIWDLDVLEELAALWGLKNMIHLPLATLPEYWPQGFVPLEDRPLTCCFLGNCHFTADWVETDPDPLMAWARDTVSRKIATPDRPMQACLGDGFPSNSPLLINEPDPWRRFVLPWEILNSTYMHRTRNQLVQAAAEHLKGKFALIGKGWDKLDGRGLCANLEHAGDKSGVIYGQSQVCLNLYGGCVHGGMPLRPFDIGVSGGLIATHYQRELPALFEEGKECLAFRNADQMCQTIDRIRATPREYNPIALAGRRRVLVEHTWHHRIKRLMDALAF